MQTDNNFDAIVIGSGIGGLTTAVLLTKIYKQRVLVLEKHFVVGGQTHEFMRVKDGKKYYWDVGVHYVGEMAKGVMSRKIFDFVTDGNLKWNKMPHLFENFVYPDFNFRQPANPKEFENALIEKFPDEEKGIKQYFKDIKKAAKWFQSNVTSKLMPGWLFSLMNVFKKDDSGLALSTTKDYLDSIIGDEKLKAILTTIWGDYGVPPAKSAFVMHAIVVRSYLYGGYFPIGGASAIAGNMVPIIEKGGGKVLTSCDVNEIIIENGKATGVKFNKKDKEYKYFGKNIISDTGAYNTYIKLIPDEVNIPYKDEIKNAVSDFSTTTLYVGLKESAEKLGIKGENYWISTSYDHDKTFEQSKKNNKILSAFVSFPSIKNPEAKSHTAELITFSHYDNFKKWKDTHWLKRGKDYAEMKQEISENLLNFVEKYIPGFKELVDYAELSTPLTLEYFTEWPKGSFYGIPATPERFKYKWISPKTPIKNLYLSGSDALSIGVVGAMMGGVFSVAAIKGMKGFMKMMKEIS
ncbi:MAG TPA: NAD(P)/FAD-dependent oxidoreductase [Bacteroidetes bacterium]|nr:NAD(P)/FAD-dependent oxidoreductase [Bacteroidota bacterium]